jgi:hypothetical protein
MPDEKTFTINVNHEIDRYFDASSISGEELPRIIILMGAPACGKTTLRKQIYATGCVLVDAAEIFLSVSRGRSFPFPSAFEEALQLIGGLVARRAIFERRHIVTEVIGADAEALESLIKAMKAIGYRIDLQLVTCDREEAQRRNLHREPDNISCYYAEPYQRRWLHEAAVATLNKDSEEPG